MCGVTTRAGDADGNQICKTCALVCCSCTHFVRTIKKGKVVKILNVGLKGRSRLRLKEIAATYQIDCEITTTSGGSPVQTSLVQRCRRLCDEIDSNNYIIADDCVFGMTLKEFQSSLGKAKKNQKILRSVISENGESYRQRLIVNPEISDPGKEEPTLPEETLGYYVFKLKGKKVRAQKCFNKIPKCIKRDELDQNVVYSVHNNDPSAHNLTCLDNTSTDSSKVTQVLVSCAIKEEADLYPRVDCFESYIDKGSSIPCHVNAIASSASTHDERMEDICKAQMQDVDFCASANILYSSFTDLPPNAGEGTTQNMFQPCLQESLPNTISKACSSFPSHEDKNNSSEDPNGSIILDTSGMNNVAPVCSKVRHEVTVEGHEALSLAECLFPIQSVINQQKISTECEKTLCLGSSEQDLPCEVKASSELGKSICQENTWMQSSFDRIDEDDEALALYDSIANDGSSPQKSILLAVSDSLGDASSTDRIDDDDEALGFSYSIANDGSSPQKSILLAVSDSLDDASSTAGEISRTTAEPTACPVQHFTSVALVNQKRKASPSYVHARKVGKYPRILLSSRKMISPKSQERLCLAMYAQEHNRNHLSSEPILDQSEKINGLNLRDSQTTVNDLDMKRKSENGLDDSPPIREKIFSKNASTDFSLAETDSQKAVRFTKRQMHDIESLAEKLLKKLKCMKNIVEERLCGAASLPAPSKYTDEEIRGATESVGELEDGARRLLAVMARDCNRFCKIMNTSGKKGLDGELSIVPKERKKIMFADEAGGELCHVKILDDSHST